MVKKILYSPCYGGFGFSDEILKRFGIESGEYSREGYKFNKDLKNRTDPEVIKAVEEIGLKAASGRHASLRIEEIDDDDIYEIQEHDGYESLVFVCRARNNLVY